MSNDYTNAPATVNTSGAIRDITIDANDYAQYDMLKVGDRAAAVRDILRKMGFTEETDDQWTSRLIMGYDILRMAVAAPSVRKLTEEEYDLYHTALYNAASAASCLTDYLSLLHPMYSKSIPTLGTDEHFRVSIGGWFFDPHIHAVERGTMLIHEVMHGVLGHYELTHLEPDLVNQAGDAVINQGIEFGHKDNPITMRLPENRDKSDFFIFPRTIKSEEYPDGMRNNESFEKYYAVLKGNKDITEQQMKEYMRGFKDGVKKAQADKTANQGSNGNTDNKPDNGSGNGSNDTEAKNQNGTNGATGNDGTQGQDNSTDGNGKGTGGDNGTTGDGQDTGTSGNGNNSVGTGAGNGNGTGNDEPSPYDKGFRDGYDSVMNGNQGNHQTGQGNGNGDGTSTGNGGGNSTGTGTGNDAVRVTVIDANGDASQTSGGNSSPCRKMTSDDTDSLDENGVEKATDIDKEMARAGAIAKAMDQQSKDRASSGTAFTQFVLDHLRPPKVNWANILRGVISRRVNTIISGNTDYSYRRPNRRHNPNGFIRPSSIAYAPSIIVGCDCSGSMSDSDYAAALGEIEGMCKAIHCDNLRFVTVDTHITSNQVVRRASDLKLVGGGGTCMAPFARYCNELPMREQPDMVILCTDGYCDWAEYIEEIDPTKQYVILVTDEGGMDYGGSKYLNNAIRNLTVIPIY